MAAMKSDLLKILVLGDVEGNFKQFYQRVKCITRKSPFEMLFCVGDFFGQTTPQEWAAFVDNHPMPLPTYILGPIHPNQEALYPASGGDLHSNIYYLGKLGIFQSASKLKIAYLSGTDNGKGNCQFTSKDIDGLCALAENKIIDILLTSQWPEGITKYGKTVAGEIIAKSNLISKLAFHLKPRYHFVGLNHCFYERSPYRNHQILAGQPLPPTRFIALGKVNRAKDVKSLYAFTIQPYETMNKSDRYSLPEYISECPYDATQFRAKKEIDLPPSKQFFFDTTTNPEHNRGQRGEKRKFNHKQEFDPRKKFDSKGSCWFCLKSTEVAKHLVLSIGQYSYLSLAKGGLTPDHLLILPMDHNQSIVDVSEACNNEILRFMQVLQKFFKFHGQGVVFYERNFKSTHLQIQVMPVPLEMLPKVRPAFEDLGAARSVNFVEIPAGKELRTVLPPKMKYFWVEFGGVKLCHHIKTDFPIQFGREILCSSALLNLPNRVEWKPCVEEAEIETRYVEDFKARFKEFDFNQEDEDDLLDDCL